MKLQLNTQELHGVIKNYVASLGLNLENQNVAIDIKNDVVDIEVLPAGVTAAPKAAAEPRKTRTKKAAEITTAADAFITAEAPADEDASGEDPKLDDPEGDGEAAEDDESLFSSELVDEAIEAKQTTESEESSEESEFSIFN